MSPSVARWARHVRLAFEFYTAYSRGMEPPTLDGVVDSLGRWKGHWREISAACGVPYHTVAKIAQKRTPNPRIRTIEKLHTHLAVIGEPPNARGPIRTPTFPAWLDAEQGRATRIAEHFKVTRSAVSQWRTNGIPVHYILDLHALIGGDVPLDALVRRPAAKAEAA